jgi:hypothetical protein
VLKASKQGRDRRNLAQIGPLCQPPIGTVALDGCVKAPKAEVTRANRVGCAAHAPRGARDGGASWWALRGGSEHAGTAEPVFTERMSK